MQTQTNLPVPTALVIVVDDDRAVRNSLKFSLEIEGFSVRTYACGGDLLTSCTPLACACLVVDQNLPGMTGLDLIGRLRIGAFPRRRFITTHLSAVSANAPHARTFKSSRSHSWAMPWWIELRDACAQDNNSKN